jgi:hypothetical protein
MKKILDSNEIEGIIRKHPGHKSKGSTLSLYEESLTPCGYGSLMGFEAILKYKAGSNGGMFWRPTPKLCSKQFGYILLPMRHNIKKVFPQWKSGDTPNSGKVRKKYFLNKGLQQAAKTIDIRNKANFVRVVPSRLYKPTKKYK